MEDQRRLRLLDNEKFGNYLENPPKIWIWAYTPERIPTLLALPGDNLSQEYYKIIASLNLENHLASGISTEFGHGIFFHNTPNDISDNLELLLYLSELPLTKESRNRSVVYLKGKLRPPNPEECRNAKPIHEEILKFMEMGKALRRIVNAGKSLQTPIGIDNALKN